MHWIRCRSFQAADLATRKDRAFQRPPYPPAHDNRIQVLFPRSTPRMSHIVTITTKVQDPAAIAAACRRLGLPAPVHGTAALFSGEAAGLLVKLSGWLYPIVVDTATGQVAYDNFEGSWGSQAQ